VSTSIGSVGAGRPAERDLARSLPAITLRQALFLAYIGAAMALFVFLVPPFQKSDELNHFWRAVSLTNLDLVCHSDSEGNRFYPMKRKYGEVDGTFHVWEVALNYRSKWNNSWPATDFSDPRFDQEMRIDRPCDFTPLGYPPATAGVLAGKPFADPRVSLYLGRLGGALFFLACLIWALQVVPDRYRLLVYLYAALPSVLHQVTTISYDQVHLSLLLPVFAYWARFLVNEQPVPRRDLLIFCGLLVWSVNVRLGAFMPMVLLFFALRPEWIAAARRRYVQITAGFVAAAVGLMGLLTLIYIPRGESEDGERVYSSTKQLQFVLEDPTRLFNAIYNTLRLEGAVMVHQLVAGFGWQDYGFDFFTQYLWLFIIACVMVFTVLTDSLRMKPLQLLALWGSVLGTTVTLFIAAYFFWSHVGAPSIWGVQGRYFLVLLPLLIVAVAQLSAALGRERMVNFLLVAAAIIVLRNIYRAIDLRYFG
jgi:uncharacterized membrane protein